MHLTISVQSSGAQRLFNHPVVYTCFKNVAAGRITHLAGPRVGHPWYRSILSVLEFSSHFPIIQQLKLALRITDFFGHVKISMHGSWHRICFRHFTFLDKHHLYAQSNSSGFRLTFRHRASSILGQAFRYSPENAFYIFNQQIYFIIWYLLDRVSLI